MKPNLLNQALSKVKGGLEFNYAFIKGKTEQGHALAISGRKIVGPMLNELKEETDDKNAKVLKGSVRYSVEEARFIFTTTATEMFLTAPLKQIILAKKLQISKFRVEQVEAFEEKDLLDPFLTGGETPSTESTAQPETTTPIQPETTTPTQTPPPVKIVLLQQCRLAYDATRKKIAAEIEKLKAAITEIFEGDEDLPKVVDSFVHLDAILTNIDERLLDKLDQALNNADPAGRFAQHQEAREIVKEYNVYLTSDPIFTELDENPFVPITARQALVSALKLLDTRLAG